MKMTFFLPRVYVIQVSSHLGPEVISDQDGLHATEEVFCAKAVSPRSLRIIFPIKKFDWNLQTINNLHSLKISGSLNKEKQSSQILFSLL